jgi:hypothetical protein
MRPTLMRSFSVDVFAKKTNKTPKDVLSNCKRRLREFEGDLTETMGALSPESER